jgi:toxin ParE1/3/4
MIHTINFEKRALEELNDAIEWYEKQQKGLGTILRGEIIRQVTEIDKDPTKFRNPYRKFRVASTSKFPYQIVYLFFPRKKVITITAIFHHKRHPKKKF